MRRCIVVGLVVLALGRPAGLQAQGVTRCVTPREACAFFDAYLTAFNERNWDVFRATLADDITVMFDSPFVAERRDGRAAVEDAFRRVFPPAGAAARPLPPPVRPENLMVQDLGDVVIVSFHMRDPEQVARRTVVLRRAADGWKVSHIHASSFATAAR